MNEQELDEKIKKLSNELNELHKNKNEFAKVRIKKRQELILKHVDVLLLFVEHDDCDGFSDENHHCPKCVLEAIKKNKCPSLVYHDIVIKMRNFYD